MLFPNLLYRISYSTIFRSSNIFFHCNQNMHKSITTTFVLLVSSLVMLAVMPLFNNNNVKQWRKDTTIMKIVYYSQYPTDDKKYECRTGPFEGFFVSSVEFCKHIKFDDDRKDKVEIIKQEHKVHQVHQVPKVILVQLEQQVQPALLATCPRSTRSSRN